MQFFLAGLCMLTCEKQPLLIVLQNISNAELLAGMAMMRDHIIKRLMSSLKRPAPDVLNKPGLMIA